MKKRERTKSNDIFSVWKCKSFLLLLLVGVCFTLTASIITNYFRDKEPDVNEALEEYLSSSFASNINNLYIYDIDKPMEDFMDSSAVTSFFFCSSSYPAADELLDYLCNNLTAMAERADYITAAAVYASASNTFVTSHTDKITDSQLNDLLKDLVYNYNSNSVDKNSLSGESYNTFLFKYEDYVVFSKDLTTLSGASYSSMFLLMDADAFSSFVYRANGMIPYKVSIYDSHNTLLFSNSDRSEKENYSQLINFTTEEVTTEQAGNSSYIYCNSDITGFQYLLEMEQLPLPGDAKKSPFMYLSLFIGLLLLSILGVLLAKRYLGKSAGNTVKAIKQLKLSSPDSLEALTSQINEKISAITTENTTMKNIISATSTEAVSHLFAKVIVGEPVEAEETRVTLANTGYGFQPDDIYIAGILHQTTTDFITADSRYKILNMLNSVFEKFKEKHQCNLCAFLFDEKSFIIIASFPAGTSIAKGKARINDLTQQINEGISFLRLPMAVAFGHMYSSILDLSFSYNEAFKSMHYKVEAQNNGFSTNASTFSHSFPPVAPAERSLDVENMPEHIEAPDTLKSGDTAISPELKVDSSFRNRRTDSFYSPGNIDESVPSDMVSQADTISQPEISFQANTISETSTFSAHSSASVQPETSPQADSVERVERRATQIAQLIWDNREEGLPSLIDRTMNNIFSEADITLQEELSKRIISALTSHMLSYPFVNDSHLSNVYDDLATTIQNGASSEELKSSLLSALNTLCQDFSEILKKQRNPYIIAAQEYIGANYSNPDLSLEEIAENLKIAPNYLSTIFSKNLGIKLFEYVNEYRLEKSIELLLHTDKTVNEISTECGFGSSRNYIRIFKKYKDNTPGAYRKQHIAQG